MTPIYGVASFKEITNYILDWNYEPVNGTGVYSKTEKYGHVEISIYSNDYDKIVWNVEEAFIPPHLRSEIESVLIFFNNYLTALKGNRDKGLVFEVKGGSFNNDSGRFAFMYATTKALANCFDKQLFDLSSFEITRIEAAKEAGLKTLREILRCSSQEEIIESLQDIDLTVNVFKALDSEKVSMLKEVIHLPEAEEIIGDSLQDQSNYFTEKNIITKYGDLTRIGLGHIAVIVKNIHVLPYIGVFDVERIKYKFL